MENVMYNKSMFIQLADALNGRNYTMWCIHQYNVMYNKSIRGEQQEHLREVAIMSLWHYHWLLVRSRYIYPHRRLGWQCGTGGRPRDGERRRLQVSNDGP